MGRSIASPYNRHLRIGKHTKETEGIVMLHLVLVRHGQTDWNVQRKYQGQTDIPLNNIGRQQAQKLAPRMGEWSFDAACVSDLSRAWVTAEIITQGMSLSLQPEPRLREMGFGVVEGMTFTEMQAQYPEMVAAWLADRNKPPKGGEKQDEFTARVQSLINDLKQKHDGQTVLLVAHGGPLRELIRLSMGLPPSGRWYFKMENTSLTELVLYDNKPELRRLNDITHLNGLRTT
jgi:broad specificity phosphatase PhoE